MSRQQMAFIFFIIFFGLLIGVYGKYVYMLDVRDDISEINRCLDFAALSASETLRMSYGSDDVLSGVSDDFFTAYELCANDDVSDLYLFIPAFVFCDTGGFRIGSLDSTDYKYKWTELKPYVLKTGELEIRFGLDDSFRVSSGIYTGYCSYESFFETDSGKLRDYEITENRTVNGLLEAYSFDINKDNFHDLKSDAIILSLQEAIEECINEHNRIVSKMGIKYIYTTPSFYGINQESPSFVVCFQGYPISGQGRYYSNLYVRSGYIGRKPD